MAAGKSRKTDKRTIETKMRVTDAFLALKKNRGFADITVSDLCRRAEISRGTFYLHYRNTAEVLDEILASALADIRRLDDYLPGVDQEEVLAHTVPLCEIVIRESKYSDLLCDLEMTDYIVRKVASMNGDEFMAHMRQHTTFTEEEIDTFACFQINGCLALARKYKTMGTEEWREKKKIIDQFIFNSVKLAAPGTPKK